MLQRILTDPLAKEGFDIRNSEQKTNKLNEGFTYMGHLES